MPEAFVFVVKGERKIVLHAPVIMSLSDAQIALEDLLTAMLRAREPEPMSEGEIYPPPEPRPPRIADNIPRKTRSIEDLML